MNKNNHKLWVSEVFDRSASQYGQGSCSFFDYFGKRLVEMVPVKASQKALDVATGKGAILFPLAKIIGPAGKVVGVDISEQMLKETSILAKKAGMDWIDLLQMDAEQLEFDEATFDYVFCGFALFFFPSISKALSEFKRILKPGGTLAVSTFGKPSEFVNLVSEEMDKLCKTTSLAISPLWSRDALQKELEEARFKNIRIIEETKECSRTTPEEWWNGLWSHGARAKLEQLSLKQVSELRETLIKKVKNFDLGNGLIEKRQVFYGIAQS